MHIQKHAKRQADSYTLPTVSGLSGIASASSGVTASSFILDTSAGASTPTIRYSIAGDPVTLTDSTSPTSSASASSASVTQTVAASSATTHSSQIPIGTVVGICVGVFAGVVLLIYVFYLCSKRSIQSAKSRDGRWNKLADGGERLEGASPTSPGERELQEKNSRMFKKSSPSTRTARTKITDEDHAALGLPQFEFAKYHPGLARELALEEPVRPYAPQRGESGFSWDGSTVHDSSFLEMRSVRVDSGSASPTMGFAKATPEAELSPVHQWESAEVQTMAHQQASSPTEMQGSSNEDPMRNGRGVNPFFNAQELQRRPSRSRSRSNSRTSRLSRVRSASEAAAVPSRAASLYKSERASNPFSDIQEVPLQRVTVPDYKHDHTDSVASSNSANMFGEHAMKSLIAALELPQEEIEERLRVVSINGSVSSRLSAISGQDDDADMATVRAFPMPPPAAHIVP